MLILAIFTELGTPKAGLTPLIYIYRLDTDALVVNGVAMAEVGGGQYKYSFTAWDSALDYGVRCDSVTLIGSERYAYSSISAPRVIESTLTTDDMLRIILSKEVGVATGGGSTLIEFKSLDLAKTRVAMSTDLHGNRSTVTVDGSE
jgi:hypothetical protein